MEIRKDQNGRRVFGILFLTVLAVYFSSLKNYFINDDFLHLEFIRNFKGNYLEFLLPHVRPSDVVTNARYEPLHIYFYALLYPVFGTFFPAYQFLHLVLHALNGFLVFRIGRNAGISAAGSLLGALCFCVYRLNSQSVLWYAGLFCTAAVTLMLLAFLLFMKRGFGNQTCSVLLFLAASLMSLRAPQFLFLAAAWTAVFFRDLRAAGELGSKLWTLGACAAVTGLSLIANAVSWHYFPNEIPPMAFDFYALPAFFLNLVFPYEGGLFLKGTALALVAALAAFRWNDKAVRFLALAAVLNAFFWFLLISRAHLPYAPRYMVIASALFCLLFGHVFGPVLADGRDLRRALAAVLAVGFITGNVYLVVTQDIDWFKYLSVRGEKLQALAREAGEGKRKVLIKDDFYPGDSNLNFFKDRFHFVSDTAGGGDVIIVDLEREKYAEKLGRDIGKEYWFQPWFVKKPCKEETPWC